MGVYNTVLITTTDETQRINSLLNYLNGLNGVTAEIDTKTVSTYEYNGVSFSFDSTDISGFIGWKSGSELLDQIVELKNGNTTLISPTARTNLSVANLSIHSYVDDGCIIISLKDIAGIEVVLLALDGATKLIGYIENTSAAQFVDISSLTFEKADDSARIPYSYANMFPYVALTGTLDFLVQSYFINNGVRKYTSTFFKECSTVTLLSTVSLPSPLGNHLAIGAHCIVPITEGGTE